jgi:hypothetical protein
MMNSVEMRIPTERRRRLRLAAAAQPLGRGLRFPLLGGPRLFFSFPAKDLADD